MIKYNFKANDIRFYDRYNAFINNNNYIAITREKDNISVEILSKKEYKKLKKLDLF